EAAYRAEGRREPRRVRWMYAAMIVPVVNLVYPGVFLTELARSRRRGGADGNAPDDELGPGLGAETRPARSAVLAVARQSPYRIRAGYRRLRDGTTLLVLVRFWWG